MQQFRSSRGAIAAWRQAGDVAVAATTARRIPFQVLARPLSGVTVQGRVPSADAPEVFAARYYYDMIGAARCV